MITNYMIYDVISRFWFHIKSVELNELIYSSDPLPHSVIQRKS